jgi:hypothetical protein
MLDDEASKEDVLIAKGLEHIGSFNGCPSLSLQLLLK